MNHLLITVENEINKQQTNKQKLYYENYIKKSTNIDN